MNEQHFTDLARVSIYHFCDVEYEREAKLALSRLHGAGVISSLVLEDVGEEAYAKYEAMVVEYALDHLPKGYELRRDYWGAKIISNDHGWSSPKTGLYAGDSMGRIMWFDSFAALKEYTERQLEIIPNL